LSDISCKEEEEEEEEEITTGSAGRCMKLVERHRESLPR
jgi:hypothetical protein